LSSSVSGVWSSSPWLTWYPYQDRPQGSFSTACYGQRRRGEDLRGALLRVRRFDGLQQTIEFNDHGDAQRRLYITRVSGGRYVVEAG
ncbi:hypothetical protein, partial [Tepidicella xavieri]